MNNNIVSLQRRGAVFIACHDSIHAIARAVHANPAFSANSADKVAADLILDMLVSRDSLFRGILVQV